MMLLFSVIAFAALMSTPYIFLRERRLQYALVDLSSYGVIAALWSLTRVLEVRLEPSLAFALFIVAKLTVFALFLCLQSAVEGWNAQWAGSFAGALYLILVPYVLHWPIDGDEPYYLLVTESLVADRDLDLRNQYDTIARSRARRTDLRPQLGDPVGRGGQQYSRTEPFLSLLLVPGYLLAGLVGAVATIAVFGGLLVRSTILLLQEEGEGEGISDRASRICFVFLALGPPVIFYSTRLWPEVPAAFFLVEALRAFRRQKQLALVFLLLVLSLLKLRFILIAGVLVLLFIVRARPRMGTVALGAALIALPMLIAFFITGQWLNVHGIWELQPQDLWKYARGAFGLLGDAQAGVLFQAPLFAIGLAALARWRELTPSARIGLTSSALYLLLLLPRDEWHGGWSPPLRYVVVITPLLALAAAPFLERLPAALYVLIGTVTAALVVHGIAFPWRLFHIANGESVLGEMLSSRYHSDFSRLLPSFIRLNRAAIVTAALIFVMLATLVFLARKEERGAKSEERRGMARSSLFALRSSLLVVSMLSLLIAGAFVLGRSPGSIVHFEDSHVHHTEGELYPHQWTVGRFGYAGGWRLRVGDAIRFQYDGGASRLFYLAAAPVQLEIDHERVVLPGTGTHFSYVAVPVHRNGTHQIRCLAGEVILDRIEQR